MKQIIYFLLIQLFISQCTSNVEVENSNSKNINSQTNLSKQGNENKLIHSSNYKISPVDEGKSDTSLLIFINKIKKIVRQKDTTELKEVLDSNIIVSYGGGLSGIKDFFMNWNLSNPKTSELWPMLNKIIYLGGTWENNHNEYNIPYTHSSKLLNTFDYNFDWYFTAVCINSDVPVFQNKDSNSNIIAILKYEIILIDLDNIFGEYTKIHTIDQTINGFVKTKDILFSAEPNLVIKNINKHWRVTSFAPFD